MNMHHTNKSHPNILQQENACLLIIDVQEKFREHIMNFDLMTKNIVTLIKVANKLHLPIIVSEQYPEGLGPTIKEILSALEGSQAFAKKAFSCCQDESFVKHLQSLGRRQILATGIESHVCVNQTVHDLITLGFQPHIIIDAISSRTESNKKIGIEKMHSSGAIISSTEMSILELLRTSANEEFKYIQSLIKNK